MRKILLICMLCYAGTTFGQIPYKTKEERLADRGMSGKKIKTSGENLTIAGNLGVTSGALLVLGAGSAYLASTMHNENVRNNSKDDTYKVFYYVASGLGLASFVCEIAAWSYVSKAGAQQKVSVVITGNEAGIAYKF